MYYLNIFQYLFTLLQSLLYPLYGIKASKGYPSSPCITSQHAVSPYERRRNQSLTATWTFPSQQQVVLTAQERDPKLRHCRTTKKKHQPFSWEGPQLLSYTLEKNPILKFNFSQVSNNKSWSTTSTINSWAIYSVRLSSQVLIWCDKTLQKLCNILLARWNSGGRQVKLQSSSALTLKGNSL